MLIRRGASEIFEAFVDPGLLRQFWLDSASAPLSADAEVTWQFKVPGVSDTLKVTKFDRPRRLALRFSDGMDVDIRLEFHDGGATRVSVTCTGFNPENLLTSATDTAEGFAIVLCDLKTLLETGRSANLVRDKAEVVSRQLAASGFKDLDNQ